jgi:N-acetylglucosaminyl-diphospho-decaprenol L-rhamnosyltransferase
MIDDVKNTTDAKGDVRTSIITVNYRVAHLIKDLVESIEKCPPPDSWELIIVDNSLDNEQASELKKLEEGRSNLKVIISDKNLGFSGGNNLGISKAEGEYLVFLNPDIVVRENCIGELVMYLDSYPECGIAAPRVYWGDGSFQPTGRAFPNPLTGLFGRATILSKLFPNNPFTKQQLIDLEKVNEPAEVDWAAGMAWAVRKDEFESAGGWDERYFMYWEDADVAFKYKHEMGMPTHYVPSAEATHFHAESAKRAGSKATRAFHNSAYKYVVKNLYPAWYDPRRWFSWLALNLRANAVILKNKLKG